VGRPPLPLGTAGSIRTYQQPNGQWRARTLYRDWDGVTRGVERYGRTRNSATRSLNEALRDRARVDGGAEIRADSKVAVLAETWFASLADKGRSVKTLEQYRYRLDHQVRPALGGLRVRELTAGVVDRHLVAIGRKHGPATAKMTRTVLSGMCGLAARHDALDRNPVRDAGSISSKPKNAPRSLAAHEMRQLLAYLTYVPKAQERDLPDFVGFMAATAMRIGEAAAAMWDAVDLDAGTVEVRGTVIREKGKGLYVKPEPKSKAGWRTLLMPPWCVEMLLLRAQTRFAKGEDPVFPAQFGGLRDPSNTQADLKEAFTFAGVPWASSHTLRKTVATLMDEAGLPARAAADQLGHSKTSLTQDVYYGRKVASTGAAEVLEALRI
jgi:integrase